MAVPKGPPLATPLSGRDLCPRKPNGLAGTRGKRSELESRSLEGDNKAMSLNELKLELTAVFEPAPEGGFTCHFEELPEVFSQGETLEEAKANLMDALTQVMEYHREEARKNAVPNAMREELQLAARETA